MATSGRNLFAVAFLFVVIGGRVAEAAVTCNQVVSNLYPCVEFVNSGRGPSSTCCTGVKNLNGLAQSTYDRQAVCRCLKSLINGVSYNAQNVANAAALPSKCGVRLPYAINPNVNCAT